MTEARQTTDPEVDREAPQSVLTRRTVEAIASLLGGERGCRKKQHGRTREIFDIDSSGHGKQYGSADTGTAPEILTCLGASGHAPRGLWQGGRALAASIDALLSWSARSDVHIAFDCDALSLAALACESPDVVGNLVEAIVEGRVELVAGAYSSLNGLLAGGEANIRNHLMGASTLRRIACAHATTFWQRHFSAYPQLPQILANCGIDAVVLVHGGPESTPDVPREAEALIAWRGSDGSVMRTLTKTEFTPRVPTRLGEAAETARKAGTRTAAVPVWLPLGNSERAGRVRDETLAQLRDASLGIGARLPRDAVGELWSRASQASQQPVLREYASEALWHGQSMGVNGDRILRRCARLERDILAIEALSAMQPFLGKRDAWGEYPHWEIDEAWRGLLTAQHSELREREGSLGGIALADATRAQSLVDDVRARIEKRLARRSPCDKNGSIVINALGWERELRIDAQRSETIPAYGWLALPDVSRSEIEYNRTERLRLAPEDEHLVHAAAGLRIKLHRKRGVITQIFSPDFPQGMLGPKQELLAFELRNDDGLERFESNVEIRSDIFGVKIDREGRRGRLEVRLEVLADPARIVVHVVAHDLARPGCRPDLDDEYGAGNGASWTRDAFQMKLGAALGSTPSRIHDTPYNVDVVDARAMRERKYPGPGGSAPVVERLRAPFTAQSFIDFVDESTGRGLLYAHDGGQGFLADHDGARAILGMWDPNIGGPWIGDVETSFVLLPHAQLTHEQRLRLATEHRSALRVLEGCSGDGQLPARFGGVRLEGDHAQLTAFYREDGRKLETPSIVEDCAEPWVVRLVEVDGVGGAVRLVFPGRVERALKASASGESPEELMPDPKNRNAVLVELRPREIATIRFRLA